LICDTAWHELIVGRKSMANAMLDARQEGDSYRRIEVITGQRRRRRWTAQEKARIVAESFEEGANISEVARRNGVVRGLLTVWRHKLAAAVGVNAPGFVPVLIASEGSPATAGKPGRVAAANTRLQEMASPAGQLRGMIEIEVGGARIRVEPGVDPRTLSTVLSALRGGR
jgi:transposase